MSKELAKPDIKDIIAKLRAYLERLQPYSLLIFVIFVVLLYGIVIVRTNQLSNAQPNQDAIDTQVQAARLPKVDPSVIKQIQELQDNSVGVQTLFNQARNNPFQ